MSDANIYQPSDIEEETIKDFIDSLYDELQNISCQLLTLERDPGNRETINALFRSVHSIKGNARMCFFMPISNFVHAIEEMMSEVRDGSMTFSPLMAEAISLCLDHVKICAEELYRDGHTDITLFDDVIPMYGVILATGGRGLEEQLIEIIRRCGGSVIADVTLTPESITDAHVVEDTLPEAEISDDLAFFAEMAAQIDESGAFWEHRSNTQLKIALGINQYLERPLNTDQLTAAVYLHDLGMMFLPHELRNKTERYNALEEKKVRQHVIWSHQWVMRLPGWHYAAAMILEHHERPDGRGYPNGMSGDQLSDGGQILALVDAFFAITNQRSDRNHKKSLMRAITEINSYRDVQFKGSVVDAFNSLMREIYKKAGDA